MSATVRYRAVIVCQYERCHRHENVGDRDIPGEGFGGQYSEITFPTEEEARKYGEGMNQKVYGASTHSVEVEAQVTTPWQVLPN